MTKETKQKTEKVAQKPANSEMAYSQIAFESKVLNELCRRLTQVDFRKGMATCSEDEEFYIELIQDFVNLPIKEELTSYFAEGNFENYCVRIHGFKNSAWSIGAMRLGNLAFEMEKGTREGFCENIELLQNELFGLYDDICTQYEEVRNL